MKTILPIVLLTAIFVFPFTLSHGQNPTVPVDSLKHDDEGIRTDSKSTTKNIFQSSVELESLLSPNLTSINFDDLIFSDDNSVAISSNRYTGVSFYYPGRQTFLTHFMRFSFPNSLITGNAVYNPNTGYDDIYSTGAGLSILQMSPPMLL